MYIQITTRCGMKCAHCCFAATTKGEAMERNIFMDALTLASRYGEAITIGGGEPTSHPQFFQFLDKAIELHHAGMFEGEIFMVTNGQSARKAHKLLDMIEEDDAPIMVELSQDEYHDPIDPTVVQRFRHHQRRREGWSHFRGDYPKAGIRTVRSIVPVGRALTSGLSTRYAPKCACEDILIDPKGRVWSCGCKTHQLGWVWERDVLEGYDHEYAHEGGRAPIEDDELVEPMLLGAGLPDEVEIRA